MLGLVVGLSGSIARLEILGAILFAGLGLVFLLLGVAGGPQSRYWAQIPGSILLLFGFFVLAGDSARGEEGLVWWARWWPLLPLLLGLVIGWRAFAARNAVNYSVQGQAPLRLPLSGVQEPLGNFLRDCAQFAGGGGSGVAGDATQLFSGGTSGGPANTAGATADSCAALDGVVSKNGGKKVAVEFVNRTDEYRVLMWIDFDGTPVEYTQLEAGQAYQVETSSTHPWMVTDGPGNCIEKFMPKPGQRQILISRKSPGSVDA